MLLSISGKPIHTIHFVGIFGSGMSALAQFLCWNHITVTGSDRFLHSVDSADTQQKLTDIGCHLFPQDGSGISTATDVLCISSAIENTNQDIAAAQQQGVPIMHRSDILALIVNNYQTIAVAGTSGKSTVTAMIFEFLTACGKSPSLITGAACKRLQRQNYIGNAFVGSSAILVIEADESDGTLIKYHPDIAVLLNVSKDHKPVDEVLSLFTELVCHARISLSNADDLPLAPIATTTTYALQAPAAWHPDTFETKPDCGLLTRNKTTFTLPLPGLHNLSNCAAALAVAELVGCSPHELSEAVPYYEGVARRFSMTTTSSGIFVVDDFAHNPEKIRAAVAAARMHSPRIIALYQPHGFGPTRFLRNEYRQLFSSIFSAGDLLCLLPIYYAGGTATKDIASTDLIADLGAVPFTTHAPAQREEMLPIIKDTVNPGDCILVMGARDPSLQKFTKSIIDLFA